MFASSAKLPFWQKILIFLLIALFAYISIFGFLNRYVPFMLLTLTFFALIAVLFIKFEFLVPLLILISAGVPASVKGMMLSFGDFTLYTPEIILYLLLIAFLLKIMIPSEQDFSISVNFLTLIVVLIFLVGVVSYIRGVMIDGIEARRNLRAFIFYLSFLPLLSYCKNRKNIKQLIRIWLYSIFVFLAMYYLMRVAPSVGSNANVSLRYRMIIQMVPMSIVMFFIYRIAYQKLKLNVILSYLIAIAGAMSSIILAQDRSVWVAFAISLVDLVLINLFVQKGIKRISLLVLSSLLIMSSLFLFFKILPAVSPEFRFLKYILVHRIDTFNNIQEDEALGAREEIRRTRMQLFKQNPFLGGGFRTTPSHDLYSAFLALTGLAGFIPLVLFLIAGGLNYLILLSRLQYIDDLLIRAFIVSQAAVYPAWLAINWVEPILWGRTASVFVFMLTVAIGLRLKQETDKTIERQNEQSHTELLDNSSY